MPEPADTDAALIVRLPPPEPDAPEVALQLDDVTVWAGDCLAVLAQLDDASVDAVVTDPPYGLEFMGRAWDSFRLDDPGTSRNRGDRAGEQGTTDRDRGSFGRVAYGGGKHPTTSRCSGCGKRDQFRNPHACVEDAEWLLEPINPNSAPPTMLAFGEWVRRWAVEAYRVVKPGGHIVAFGGTRTWHRLTCGLEDAGFEIRDSLAWLYAQGFPKSLDVSNYVDETLGHPRPEGARKTPITPEAESWEGWGTAFKPAHEPIAFARKPPAGTIASNVLRYGTGAINLRGVAVPHANAADRAESEAKNRHADFGTGPRQNTIYGEDLRAVGDLGNYDGSGGRWPSNVLLTHAPLLDAAGHPVGDACASGCVPGCPARELDAQSGYSQSPPLGNVITTKGRASDSMAGPLGTHTKLNGYGDAGGASRFFAAFRYPAEDECPDCTAEAAGAFRFEPKAPQSERPRVDGVAHPTVKPLDLMRWLVRAVTTPGQVVLEPFAGSGTTAEACILEGRRCIAVEQSPEYVPLIIKRLTKPLEVDLFAELGGFG